ncbi:MAG: GGDEF domain-containing protein [Ruminococcus sp.]|nr:GGDEF domain-containing protein [Ruminococcus sp.]
MAERRRAIAVIAVEIFNDYINRIFVGISEQCRALGYDSYVFTMGFNTDTNTLIQVGEENIFSLLHREAVDGIILIAGNIVSDSLKEQFVKELPKLGVPILSVDLELGGFEPIYADDSELFGMMVDHLIEAHGCRTITCLTGYEGLAPSMTRLSGYMKSMERHGLTVRDEDVIFGDFWVNRATELAEEYLSGRRELPDAIVCANDLMAIRLCNELQKGGISVPGDVKITGYDGSREALENDPPISSIYPENGCLGARAVCRLAQMMTGESVPMVDMKKGSLLLDRSCGCGFSSDTETKVRSDSYAKDDLYEKYYNNCGVLEYMMMTDNLDSMLRKLADTLYVIHGLDTFMLCIGKDWDDFESGEDDYRRSGYQNEMSVRLLWHAPDTTRIGDMPFDPASIIPHYMKEYSDEPSMYFLLPVHFLDRCFGYSVFKFDDVKHALSMVYALWNRNISAALEFLRVRTKLISINNRITMNSIRDALTGIYNRKGFDRFAEGMFRRAQSERRKLLIIMADLDLLKHINDNYGHAEGDRAISTAATVLNTTCENNEICARIGGDEYVIVGCFDYTDEIIEGYIAYINDYFDRFNSMSGKPYKVGASIGYYCGVPDEGTELSHYVEIADKRMYANKLERKKIRTD